MRGAAFGDVHVRRLHLATGRRAVDAVDAGVGDRVLLIMEGFSAMTAVGRPESPIDMAVVGVIDQIDLAPAAPLPRCAENE